MKRINYLIIVLISFLGCNTKDPVTFSEAALNDTFIALDGKSISFKDILDAHKGETLLIDVWASWCKDCLKGLPNVKTLQDIHKDVTYMFLSMDKTQKAWKRGIEKYDISGMHYFMPSGWDAVFSNFIDLDWIPRYMVVDGEGSIKVFDAIKADDIRIKENL